MMDAKICDRVTCGILTVMAGICMIQSKEKVVIVLSILLCALMWIASVRKNDGVSRNNRKDWYILLLIGLYVVSDSSVNWETWIESEDLLTTWLKAYVIMAVVVIVLTYFLSGMNRILLILLCDGVFLAAERLLLPEESDYMLPYSVFVLLILSGLNAYRIWSETDRVKVKVHWMYLALFPCMVVNLVTGDGALYLWFVRGTIPSAPVWWFWIGLLAIALVNLSVKLPEWKQAAFGVEILVFLAVLALSYLWKTDFQLHLVLVGLLVLDVCLNAWMKKSAVKNPVLRFGVTGIFLLPVVLLLSTLAARHCDLELAICILLIAFVFLFAHMEKQEGSYIRVFALGFGINLLLILIRFTNGGSHTAIFIGTSLLFWILFALNASQSPLYRTNIRQMEPAVPERCVFYGCLFVMLLVALGQVVRTDTVFYLERDIPVFSRENNYPLHAKMEGNTEEIEEVTIEWSGEEAETMSPEEVYYYDEAIHASSAKITWIMSDGTAHTNYQFFLKTGKGE